MDPDRRRTLVELMVAMAEGDDGAVFTFLVEFGPELERAIRAQLRRYGRRDLLTDGGEIDGLVCSAAFEILDRAGGWDPAGAPPWVWATQAIQACVVREIGHASVVLDPDSGPPGDGAGAVGQGPAEGGGADVDLDDLARRIPRLDLFRKALATGATPRDRAVVESFLVQKALGDPSPSHTVAAEFGLNPAAVRQIVRRLRVRVRRLQASDDRYRSLGAEGWLAA